MKLKYIGKRILIIIPTFIGITILAYVLSSMAPGDPIDMIIGNAQVSAADVERLRHQYGLDQPVIIQYFHWFARMLQGNFGVSYRTSEPVLQMILNRMGPTLLITITSVVVSILLAIPMGGWSSSKALFCMGLHCLRIFLPGSGRSQFLCRPSAGVLLRCQAKSTSYQRYVFFRWSENLCRSSEAYDPSDCRACVPADR